MDLKLRFSRRLNRKHSDRNTNDTGPEIKATPFKPKKKRDESGIALFMVMGAMAVLSVLVTDFTYITQINRKIAFDGLDQLKSHYVAKSAVKLSLLRIKAYAALRALAAKSGASAMVPKSALEQIWSFPFFFPIPSVPGMTPGQKDAISKFMTSTSLAGSTFSAVIESESTRFNVNSLLKDFAPAIASPSPTSSTSTEANPTSSPSPTTANPEPSPSASFDPEAAREAFTNHFTTLFNNKIESDIDFSADYRDYKIEDLMDQMFSWIDRTYESKNQSLWKDSDPKKAPIYSLSELHLLPGMDDTLYDLFVPTLTTSFVGGLNINKADGNTLRAFFPAMTADEAKEMIDFRDDPEKGGGPFKDEDAFYTALKSKVAGYSADSALDTLKADFKKRNLKLIVDETTFKITVRAEVNQSRRVIEAWVSLNESTSKKKTTSSTTDTSLTSTATKDDPGLKIIAMRIY